MITKCELSKEHNTRDEWYQRPDISEHLAVQAVVVELDDTSASFSFSSFFQMTSGSNFGSWNIPAKTQNAFLKNPAYLRTA